MRIGDSWYGYISLTLASYMTDSVLRCVSMSTNSSSSIPGITEAFKADKFEKKINLGTVTPSPTQQAFCIRYTPPSHVMCCNAD